MKKVRQDVLEAQVGEARRTISSDGYPMSIGELTNLYRDGELIIRPEFQRLFRWSKSQKSRLIESLLLGIPLPSIFVSQQERGKWELVDGLQRVSTILELQGELLSPDGTRGDPFVLTGTKFLPALEGRQWETKSQATSLPSALRLDIKRSKIDVKIIKRESSPETKYDLFQRLNSYGSPLTPMELRSALLVAVSPKFFSWIEELAALPSFVNTTLLSDRLLEERYDLELVIRFLILHTLPAEKINQSVLRDFPQFLNDQSVALATRYPAGDKKMADTFKTTFGIIAAKGGEEVFRRWDGGREEFIGSFLNTAYEVFALGVGYHVAKGTSYRSDLVAVAKSFWQQMRSGYATGKSTEARLAEFIPRGRELLKKGTASAGARGRKKTS